MKSLLVGPFKFVVLIFFVIVCTMGVGVANTLAAKGGDGLGGALMVTFKTFIPHVASALGKDPGGNGAHLDSSTRNPQTGAKEQPRITVKDKNGKDITNKYLQDHPLGK